MPGRHATVPNERHRTPRPAETRHIRTFARHEIEALLLSAVLDEAASDARAPRRRAGAITVLSEPGIPGHVTVKVTVSE